MKPAVMSQVHKLQGISNVGYFILSIVRCLLHDAYLSVMSHDSVPVMNSADKTHLDPRVGHRLKSEFTQTLKKIVFLHKTSMYRVMSITFVLPICVFLAPQIAGSRCLAFYESPKTIVSVKNLHNVEKSGIKLSPTSRIT